MPDKIDLLFDDLQSRGYAKDKTRKQFRDYMLAPGKQGYENRRTFFEDFKSNGETSLGSYEDFKGLLGLHATKQQKQNAPSVYQKAQGRGSIGQAMKNMSANIRQSRAVGQPQAKVEQPIQPTTTPTGLWDLDMNAKATPAFMKGQTEAPQQQPDGFKETLKRAATGQATPEEAKQTQKRLQQRMDELEYEEKTGKQLRDTGKYFSFEAPTVARDENGEMVLGDNGQPIIGRTTDEAKAEAHQQVAEDQERLNIEKQLEEAYAEKERIESFLDNDEESLRATENLIMSGGYDPTMSADTEKVLENRNAYYNSLRQIDRQIKELEAARDNAGFGRGVLNTLTDPSTYSFGLTDIEDAKQLNKIKEKIEEAAKNGVEPNLTDGEKAFVDSYLKNEDAQQLNKYNWWYDKAGKGLGQTINFMKDFALTGGGFAKIAKAGMKMGAKGGAKLASKVLGDYMKKNLGTKALGKTIEYLGKGAGLAAGAEASGFLLNNTAQAASSAADIMNRQTGKLSYDKDGNLTFEGGKSLGEAILTSQIARTGQNASELVGIAFDAMPGILGRVIQRTTAGKVLKRITDNKFWKKGENALDYLGVQSVWGEGMEEEYGMARDEILNRLTNNAYMPNGSGLFDLEQQLDTWKTVGLTSGILRVPSMIVSGRQTANYYANKYNLNASDRQMRSTFGDEARYQAVKTVLDEADNKDISKVLGNILKDNDLSREEKQAAFIYANDLIKMRSFNIGSVVAAANGYQAPPRVAGYNIKGNTVEEVDENGNVLETHEYDSREEMKAGLFGLQQERYDKNLQSDISVMKTRPGGQYGAMVEQYCKEAGIDVEEFEEMLNKPSMERTDAEQQIVTPFAELLHGAVYDNTTLHEEQSQQDGEETADADSIDIEDGSEQGAVIGSEWAAAQENRQRLFEKNEELKQEVELMESQGLSHQEIISRLETFSPEDVQSLIDYYNTEAKFNGYINRKSQKIDEEAAYLRDSHTFKGTINGQADVQNVHKITDGVNEYYLVSGNVTTDSSGRITGSTSGLIIGMDLDGSFVQLNDADGYSVMPVDQTLDQYEEAERIRLQQQVTSVIDPEGRLRPTPAPSEEGKQQGAQPAVEAGQEQTGADEAAGETPIEQPTPAPQEGGTALDRIPKDEKGNPLYEQASAEDTYDALLEQVGNKDTARVLVQNQISKAKDRLKKLQKKMEKGDFEGNSFQEQIESSKKLQQSIDEEEGRIKYWTSVLTVPQKRMLKSEPAAPAETAETETPATETPSGEVPEWRYDTPEAARERGYKIIEGNRVDRQEEKDMPKGMEVEVQYSTKDKVKGRLTVSELGDVQGSHLTNGQRNERHFLPEAQPKAEFGADRQAAAQTNASEENFRPELTLTFNGTQSAYSGSASQTNRRGEVIQGNGRRNLAEYVYAPGNEAVAKKYKEFLMAHAEELGTTAEEIAKMEKPFAHIVLDVSDEEAIRLGQFTAQDLESGGKKVPEVSTVTTKLGDKYSTLANIILKHDDPDASLADRIDANAEEAVKWLNNGGFINNTEAKTLLEDKALCRQFIKDLITDQLFKDAHPDLRTMFYELPKNIQSAIISVVGREVAIENGKSILKDIQESIRAYHELTVSSPEFANATGSNFEKRYAVVTAAVNDWLRQINIDGTVNSEKFSNFALKLAKLYKSLKDQKTLAGRLRDYYDLASGTPRELGIFDAPASAEPMSKEEIIKQIFGIEYGRQRTVPVAGNNQSSEEGREGSADSTESGESEQEGAGQADNRGGDTVDGEVTPTPTQEEEAATPSQQREQEETSESATSEEDNAPTNPIEAIEKAAEKFKEEQKEKEEPQETVEESAEEPVALTLEALEASDLDESIKSGARAWLNGDKSQGNQFAFLIAQDYVRNIHGNLERGGTDADTSQLGSEDNVSAVGGDGQEGRPGERLDTGNDEEGVSEATSGGENSQGDVASGDGARGDRGVSGQAPEQDEDTSSNGPDGSSPRGKNGVNGRQGGRRSGSSVSKRNAGGQKSASAREELDDALKEFVDALKSDITDPIKGKLLAADPISLYAFLGGTKAIKVLSAGTKVAYAAIKLGYYEFKEWVDMMKSNLGAPLRDIAGMNDGQIDGFIEMLWDYDLTIDGVTHKVREWATLMSEERLREQMAMTIEQKRKIQKDAEKTPVILEDITNIRETLPFLLPKQQEDVQKAERQFFNESHADAKHGHGKGYMFTNGTGTGKTYTGLGIVKRFLKQGKGRVLIVTVNEKKINDWIGDAKNLGIAATMLPDTKSKGSGVVVTQYANMRDNRALLEDEFDLIVYDESQEIMKNQDGMPTSTSFAHHMLANRDIRQAARREVMAGDFGKQIEAAREEHKLLNMAMNVPTDQWTADVKAAYEKAGGTSESVEERFTELNTLIERFEDILEERVDQLLTDSDKRKQLEEAVKKTKVVFLSATPFNTPANLDYAESYIFSYTNTDEVAKEDVRLGWRDSFLMKNFNASHARRGRVVSRIAQERIPDPQKASEEEVAFSDMLQDDLETMSGRDLDSEYDYSREFPKMDFKMAAVFNDAVQSLSDGRFNVLRQYFDHLLDDYTTMTGYLEIFKAQMIAPRIREYIDLGKKVTLYHRRKASNATMEPPFSYAMQKAQNAAKDNPKVASAINDFTVTFKELFVWESKIDYMFPQDSILREFMTDEEKDTYKNAVAKWMTENGAQVQRLQNEVLLLNLQLSDATAKNDSSKMAALLDQIRAKNKELDKLLNKRPKPKCAVVSVFNGSETQKDRSDAIDKFNDDNSTTKVLVIQVQSGGTGISLHDTTGKYPRVQIGIFLPQSPIEFIQTEGRVFRIGNKSNAVFEYPLLGLDIELTNFALKINGRSETTENLALGRRGRGLRDSISRSALASRSISPKDAKGIGGKELDSKKAQQADDFDAAMQNYAEWRQDPKPSDINEIEIPDPIGYIMSMLGRSENGDRVLVPNARRGSVARYIPSKSRLTAMEERNSDYARLSALIGGSGRKILNESFQNHSRVNKYDVVVLNTGHGIIEDKSQLNFGNLATTLDAQDVLKACKHIEDSGRVVALVDSSRVGSITAAVKTENCVPVMEVKLPAFVMGDTPCSIVVYDKIDNKDKRNAIGSPSTVDLSTARDEDALFAQIRNITFPNRNIDEEGRIERRLRSMINPFEKTGCVGKAKNWRTNKMEADIETGFGRFRVKFNNNKMMWINNGGRWRSFIIDYDEIVKNNTGYIQRLAQDWKMINDQLALNDEELKHEYRACISYGSGTVEGVRDCLGLMSQSIELALNKTPMQLANLANGKVENEVSGSYDLAGFRQVFDSLNANNAELEALADKVFDAVSHIEGLKFVVQPGEVFRSGGGHNVVAHFVPSRNVIELNGDVFNSIRYRDGFKAQTIVHEMIHALTSWALETYDDPSTRDKLTPEQQEACRTIKDVYSQINNDDFRRQLRLNSKAEDNAEYGMTNEHEMMAELANPVFRAALKAKKLWNQLINGVKMLLGIQIPGNNAEETDALTALDNALDTLMNNYDPNLYASFVRNSETVRNMEVPEARSSERRRREYAERQWRRAHNKAANTIKALGLSENVTVVDYPEELAGYDSMTEEQKMSKGWYDKNTGNIVVIVGNHTSPEDVQRTILREGVARYGMRKLFGNNYNNFLDNVLTNANTQIHEKIADIATEKGIDVWQATEEYLARLANDTDFERAMKQGWWSKIKGYFLDMLHSIGLTDWIEDDLSDNELRYMLWRSYVNLTEPNARRNVFNKEDTSKREDLNVGDYAERTEPKMEMPNAAENSRRFHIPGITDPMEAISAAAEQWKEDNKEKLNNRGELSDNEKNNVSLSENNNNAEEKNIHKRRESGQDSPRAVGGLEEGGVSSLLGDKTRQILDKVGRQLGITIRVTNRESDADSNGEWDSDARTITLSVDIASDSHRAIMKVFGHELTHHIKEMSKDYPEVWNAFVSIVKERMGEETFNSLFKIYRRLYDVAHRARGMEMLDKDGIEEEICAEFAGESLFTDEQFVKELIDRVDREGGNIQMFVKRMLDYVKDLVNRLKSVLNGNDSSIIKDMITLDSAKTIWSDMYQYAAEKSNVSNSGKKLRAEGDPISAIERAAHQWRLHVTAAAGATPVLHSAKAVYEDRLNRVETVFSEAYQDAMVSLKTAQNAIAKDKEIPDSQNAYMAENLMHGKNKNEQDLYNIEYRDPLIETINKIMTTTGMNWGDVDRYVYTKSGLERNREFFVRDWLEAERSRTIRKYEDLNEEEQEIYDEKAKVIEEQFEDGDIDEAEKNKRLRLALQEAHMEYLDDIESGWHREKAKATEIGVDGYTFADYLSDLTRYIKENISDDYDPSEHDYSGFRAMFGDAEGKYDEADIIDELMDAEDRINRDDYDFLIPTVDKLWVQIRKATRYGLERYREAGMRSDEQIDEIESMFYFYVPMRGFKEDKGEDMYQYFTGKGRTKSYVGGLLKHAKGRGSEAEYPISTIFAMTYKAIADCNQNMVNQKLYRLCQANPNDLIVLSDSWAVLNTETGQWEESGPDIPADATEDEVRNITLAWEDEMRRLSLEGKAKKITGRPRFDYVPLDKEKKSEHEIDVRINGKPRKMFVVGNPRMAQALNGQLRFEKGRNVFSKLNAAIKNFMASLFTSYSPTFALRNMMRDWTHFRTMLGVREGEGYARQANKYYRQSLFKMVGLFKKYRADELDMSKEIERDFKDFMDNGGITGFVQMLKIDDIQKQMEKLYKQQKEGKPIRLNNAVWDYTLGAVEALNEGIENNARFATFRASRHYAGRTKARSAYDAKEITVNFNRKGAGGKTAGFKSDKRAVEDTAKLFGISSQILGEGRIFFNATVQAIATTFKNFQNPDGSLNKKYIAKWAAKYALPPFMFGLALPMINKMLAAALDGGDGDDDPYANLPEWTRRKNICIYAGNNNFITIPIGQELAAFLTLGDIFAGNTYAPELKPVDRDLGDEMVDVMNTFSPVDISTKITKGGMMEDPISEVTGRTFSVLAPLVAVEQNLSWTGRPIYREDKFKNDKYVPEYQMVYSSTNPVMVSASQKLHELGGGNDRARGKEWSEVNPAIIQYLWEQYTGGPGKVFSNTISIGKDVKDYVSGKGSDFNIRKVEGIKAFIQQGDDRTQYYRAQSKFFKYQEDADKFKYDHDVSGLEKQAKTDPAAKLELDSLMKTPEYQRYAIIKEVNRSSKKEGKVGLDELRKEIYRIADRKEKRAKMQTYNHLMKEVVDLLDQVGKE